MNDEAWLEALKISFQRIGFDRERVSALTLTSTFDWAEFDSLSMVEMILDLEQQLDIDIPDSAFPFESARLKEVTVAQIIEHLKKFG